MQGLGRIRSIATISIEVRLRWNKVRGSELVKVTSLILITENEYSTLAFVNEVDRVFAFLVGASLETERFSIGEENAEIPNVFSETPSRRTVLPEHPYSTLFHPPIIEAISLCEPLNHKHFIRGT